MLLSRILPRMQERFISFLSLKHPPQQQQHQQQQQLKQQQQQGKHSEVVNTIDTT